jgi:hypothetical protein
LSSSSSSSSSSAPITQKATAAVPTAVTTAVESTVDWSSLPKDCQIRIREENGHILQGQFNHAQTLRDVLRFVQQNQTAVDRSVELVLVNPMPRTVYDPLPTKTLKELQLTRVTLIAERKQ